MKRFILLFSLVFIMLFTLNAQTKRELNVEKDGYKWYLVKRNDDRGVQSLNGKTIIPTKHHAIIYNKGAFSVIANDIYSIYDLDGSCIIPSSRGYSLVVKQCKDDIWYFTIERGGKHGICDENGAEIIAPIYDNLVFYDENSHTFKYKNISGDFINTGISIKKSNYNYTYKFSNYLIANKNINGEVIVNISKSGIISFTFDDNEFKFNCTAIEYNDMFNSSITFRNTKEGDSLTMYGNGIFIYDVGSYTITTDFNERVKKDFSTIMDKVKSKTFFSTSVPVRRK